MKFTSPDIPRDGKVPDMSEGKEAIRQAGAAMSGFGKSISQIGESIQKVQDQRKKVSQQSEFDTMRVSAEQDYMQSLIELDKENPDSEVYAQKAVKNYDDVVNRTLKKTKDPDVQRAFQHAMQLHKLEVLGAVKNQELRIWRDKNIADKSSQIESYKKLAAQTTDATLFKSYKDTIKYIAESMATFSSQEKSRELRDASLREVDQANLKTQILDDPILAVKKLDSNFYNNLDPNDVPYFRHMAEGRVKQVIGEIEDAQVNSIYGKLKEAYGNDYETMYARLRDPAYLKRTFGDIDVKVKTKVEQHLAEEKLRFDDGVRVRSDVLAKEVSLNLGKPGFATTQDIDKRVAEGLDWKIGEHFKNELRNPPEEQQKNPEAYNRMLKRIYAGTESSKDLTSAILSEKMPRSDKQELLREAYRDEDRLTDEAVKKADSFLNKYIVSKGMLEKALPPEEEALYKAQQGLRQQIAEEAKTKKRKLTPEEISDIAQKIAPLYRKDLALRMAEFQKNTKEQGAKMQRWMKYKTAQEVKDAKDITPGEKLEILKARF